MFKINDVFCEEANDGTLNGGAGAADIDFNDPRIQALVDTRVSEATTGLKNKNTELLGAMDGMKNKLKGYGDITPEKFSQIMDTLNSSEEAKLIADGKFDEVIDKRTDRIRAEHADSLAEMSSKLELAENGHGKYKNLYETKLIDDGIRSDALGTGILPEALDDVIRRASDVFSLADDGTLEARGQNGELIKDDKGMLVTPERFITSLQKTHPHYWPSSQGGDLNGQFKRGPRTKSTSVEDLHQVASSGAFDLKAYRAKRIKLSGENYHKN